jgi:hypothetical protein
MPASAPARRGDPDATGPAILAIADAEEPPLRVFLGDQPLPLRRTEYARRIAEWEAWDDLPARRSAESRPETSARTEFASPERWRVTITRRLAGAFLS